MNKMTEAAETPLRTFRVETSEMKNRFFSGFCSYPPESSDAVTQELGAHVRDGVADALARGARACAMGGEPRGFLPALARGEADGSGVHLRAEVP